MQIIEEKYDAVVTILLFYPTFGIFLHFAHTYLYDSNCIVKIPNSSEKNEMKVNR